MTQEEIIYICADNGHEVKIKCSDDEVLTFDQVKCPNCACSVLYKKKMPIQDLVDAR